VSSIPTVHDPIPIAEGRVIRYTFGERLVHWLTGIAYVYLLMSGLALYTPYLYWMASVLGGGPTARFWHPWIGLVFTIGLLLMQRLWRRDMKITEVDRRWMSGAKDYIENRDESVPPADRFNAGQKQFYWVMFVGGFLLLVSGVVMWLPEYLPRGANWVRELAIIVHEVGALLTIGAFIIHVYMGIFVVPGSMHAIVHGYVSNAWARTHHRLWWNRTATPK
jgi:formate dehydrogenase subunit gamma